MSTDVSVPNRNVNLLYPPFNMLVQKALAACVAAGYKVSIFEAWRSPERQDYLYAQGRTRPGEIVTQAKAWQSFHQYGVACDIAFLPAAGQWSWSGPWDAVADIFLKHSVQHPIKSDTPHFEFLHGLQIGAAAATVRNSSILNLWATLGG